MADKTQELSKLIPGAHRMNTAEMFGAAYKYIKFLKAQVGILDFMASYDQVMNYLLIDHDWKGLSLLYLANMVIELAFAGERRGI